MFVGHHVEMLDASGKVAPDEMQPTICTSEGRLAFACITPESYLLVRL